MDFLHKKLKEVEQDKLDDELERELTNFSTNERKFGVLDKKRDTVLNTRVEKIERIRIKPENPVVKPGTLLGCKDFSESDPFGNYGAVARALHAPSQIHPNIEEARVILPELKTQNVDSLFETSKVLKKTLLVVGDYIEVTKTTILSSGFGTDSNTVKKGVNYEIVHYVDVLDSDNMYRIPSTLYTPEDNENLWYSNQLNTTELNMLEIANRYKKANIEEILEPLKIVS